MVISDVAIGLLVNLLYDSGKITLGKLFDPSRKAYNNAIKELSENYRLDESRIKNFLQQENVKTAIKEYIKKPNDSDFLSSITNEFLTSYDENLSKEYANSIVNHFFEILDAKIKNNPDLRDNLHFYKSEVAYNEVHEIKTTIQEIKERAEMNSELLIQLTRSDPVSIEKSDIEKVSLENNHILNVEQIKRLEFENKRLRLEHIWSEFEHARIVGKYSLDQVLELLSQLEPPLSKWWQTKIVANFDVKDGYYQEMVRALEGIRNGNINQPFESYFGPGQELNEIFENQFPIVGDKFRTHLDELYEMILAPRISESYLQYYFYRHKKASEEENVNDVIVNLIIIYLLTKYLDRWEWADCKLDRVVDCLIAQEEDIRSWI